MKIAVYTIALNEEQFIERWASSASDADYILIADTGSTDKTKSIAKKNNVKVIDLSISPWRFDDARNAALASLPADIDYCIALDMDEVLIPGWRNELEKMFSLGITRPRYQYTWSWKSDGIPGLQYGGDKIHLRHGYRWKHPVHEVLITDRLEEKQGWCNLEIHHYPDLSKPRSQYFPLLELSVKEDPLDDRNAYYYARELFFYREYELAKKEFKRHLSLPTASWAPERAASYRYLAKCDPANAFEYLQKAMAEDPGRREAIVEMAQLMYAEKNWTDCYEFAIDAIAIDVKPLDYLCEDFAWGALPYDLAAISAWHLGMKDQAHKYGELALSLDPQNTRLKDNLYYYKS